MPDGGGTIKAGQPTEAHASRPRLCVGCDYILESLRPRGACPECGQEFDLENASTFHRSRVMPQWARWFLRPVPWWIIGIHCLPLAPLLMWSLDPQVSYMGAAVIYALFLGIGPALVAAVRLMARSSVELRYWGDRPADGSAGMELRRWMTMLGLYVVVAVAVTWGAGWRSAFYLTRPQLDAVRANVEALPAGTSLRQPVGPWPNARVIHHRSGIVVVTVGGFGAGGWQGGGSGFVYLPADVPMPGYNRGTDGQLSSRWHYFMTD